MPASAKVLVENKATPITDEKLREHMLFSSKYWSRDFGSSQLVAARAWYSNGSSDTCSQQCFHSIREVPNKDMVALCTWIMPHACGYTKGLTGEEAVKFLDYLANRSPYADAFLMKDADFMWGIKTMAFDPACWGNLMVGGMIAARSVYHVQPIVKVWCALTDAGMNEELALFIATGCHFKATGNGFDIKAVASQSYTGHAHLNTNAFDLQSLWNFLDKDPKFLTPPFVENNKYYGLHITFLGSKRRGIADVPFTSYTESVVQAKEFGNSKVDRANDYLSKLYKSGGVSTTSVHNIFSSVKVFITEADLGFESLAAAVPKLVVAGQQVMKDFQQYKEQHK
jgi:hypothetical protein